MEEMIRVLEKLGLPSDEIERIRNYYRDDLDGLTRYVLYMRAMFDDFYQYCE